MKCDNPLNSIFIKQSNGKLSEEINEIKNIPNFFKFLKDDKVANEEKIKVLEELKKKIQLNRFISEFFSEYDNKSIYIHLFDLYTNKNTNQQLKTSIITLIEELCLNIQTGKEVYEYIFQNLSKIYRKEIKPSAENVYIYLKLLGSILNENDNIIKPKNYFSCGGGNSKFNVDLKEKSINIEYSFTTNINFKIANNISNKNNEINLIKFYFTNNQQLSLDLNPPCNLIIKDIKDEPIIELKENEWNNLIVTITKINNALNIYINLNGEKDTINLQLENLQLNFDDKINKINKIEFFNNFFGEVSSICMFTQTDPGISNIISLQFLSGLKNYKEGLWKKKIINDFFLYLKSIPSVDFKSKSVYFKSKLDKKEEKKLYDNLIFVFTPINYYKSNPNLVEDVFVKYELKFSGNIKNHQYQNYRKKLSFVCELSNFFPIAEMFLIHPETLNEQNFDLFLEIISNMLNYRKHNLKNLKNYKFFNILSMFFEKYPQKMFTKKILDSFFELGKTLFISNLEVKCSNYFKHILLNEKILSKYDTNLQIEFWNKLYLFHESDKTQVQTFLNMNRLCLILRFYDRNKYTEMCCLNHLNMIKDEYKGSSKVMNPSLDKQLANLKNLMDSIIDSQEPKNAIDLFKLLTLDLSPCLVKFILNIFINAFKKNQNEDWNKNFVFQLLQTKFEVIVINTFTHSLPDIRLELLKFVFQVHLRLITTRNNSKFNAFEKMLKTCLLPDKKFSIKNITKKPGMNIANPPKKTEEGKEEPKSNNNTNNNSNTNNNNTNNNNQKSIAKSNFAALLSKFDAPKNTISNANMNKDKNTLNRSNNVYIDKSNDVNKKNEIPIIKPLKSISGNINNNTITNKNNIKKEEKTVKHEKKSGNEDKIKEELKSKINKFKEDKKEEKKPPIKPINENIDEGIQNKIRTFTVCSNSQNNMGNYQGNYPLPKRSIYERAHMFDQKKTNYEKKNTAPIQNIYQKNNEVKKEIKSEIKNKTKKETKKEVKDEIKKVIKNDTKDNKNISITAKSNNNGKQNNMNEMIKKNILEKKISNTNNDTIKNKNKNETIKNEPKKMNKTEQYTIKKEKDKKIIEKDLLNNNTISKNESIIKDSEINNYIEKLYKIFSLWATATEVDIDLTTITLNHLYIQVPNAIGIIFLLSKIIKDKKLIIYFLNIIIKLISNVDNSYDLFFTKKNYASFLDLAFDCFKKTSKEEMEIFDLTKNVIVTLFIKSFKLAEKQKNLNPGNEVQTLFMWGDQILEENNSKEKKDLLHEFLYELFFDFLLQFKLNYEEKIKLDLQDSDFDYNNYLIKNYLMLITEIFNFVFNYELEKDIHYKGPSFIENKSQAIEIPKIVISSLRMKDNNKNEVSDISTEWLDFPLVYDIFNRYKYIWVKNNVYKNLSVDKYRHEKSSKYGYIIDKLVCNKERKNEFKSELCLFCYEDKKADLENIIPLTKIIPYTIMCILEKLKTTKNVNDFLIWVKDLKCFIRFCIMASCNLLKQVEKYKQIQENCLDTIASGFFFLKNLYDTTLIGRDKILKSLVSLFLLSFKLLKWNNTYQLKHSGMINKILKQGVNDISGSAIIQLFTEYLKDSNGNILLAIEKLYSLHLESDSKCIEEIIKLIQGPEFTNLFWQNNILKNRLLTGFFSLNSFKKTVNYRYDILPCLQETFDESYKNTILDLLPQYETELAKYSNNSLEKNIRYKNKYKTFKKNAFSWRGYWSCRDNFFCENPKFKYKLINHYTKNFMKPILVPILDISYYLPEFSGFNPQKLFRKEIAENKINLDIDKVLKLTENITDGSNKEKNKGKEKENYLVNIYQKSNLILYEKYKKIANNLEFGKEEEFSYIERDSNNKENNIKQYYLSCLVKTSHHIKGVCFIDDNNLNFKVFLNQKTGNAMSGVEKGFTTEDDDYDKDRKTCFGSYFVCHPKDKDLYKISINYDDIKWLFIRKYYYTNSAIEIYTTSNKTFYFNFKYQIDRTVVLNEILKKMKSAIPIIDDLKEGGNTIVGYENRNEQKKKNEKIKLSEIIKKWKNWEIDNFQLLMWFNIFGNRSYNDISQYPILPWVLSKYKDPLKDKAETSDVYDYQFRDMTLPLGMMELNEEGRRRKEVFLETYETLKEEPSEGVKPYIYGTSYSNPFYVSYYLVRLFPFSHIAIELQGKSFDNANRLFFSVESTFRNSLVQKTDVKELIPEFFYLPEMFLNINDLNMGELDSGEKVDDVKTPCNNNPYDFIMTMRSVLESDTVSYSLQSWADLVFGIKSRGKEAENALNIYTAGSYQENIDMTKVENKEAQLRLVEFGLIPNQIMIKECVKRDKKESILKGKEITNSTSDLNQYLCKTHNDNNRNYNRNLTILQVDNFSQDRILVLYNNNYLVEKKINRSALDKTYSIEDTNVNELFTLSNKMPQFYNPKKFSSKVIKFCQKGKLLILGGFYDGKVQIIPINSKLEPIMLAPFQDRLPILSIAIDKEEEFAFFGNSIGNISVVKMDKVPSNFKFYQTITHQMSAISYIDCNSELNLWASASIDGYINLYTLPLSKLIRIIKVPTNNLEYVFLCESPLPVIIAITEENNISEIFVYSINGKLLLRQKEEDVIKCPLILRDMNTNNFLAYILNDTVVIRSLPNLIREVCIEDVNNIFAICPSEDIKTLYGLNKSGNEIRIIKDERERKN